MADKLILERSYGGGSFLINPKDYDYDVERIREARRDFKQLKQEILNGEYRK